MFIFTNLGHSHHHFYHHIITIIVIVIIIIITIVIIIIIIILLLANSAKHWVTHLSNNQISGFTITVNIRDTLSGTVTVPPLGYFRSYMGKSVRA